MKRAFLAVLSCWTIASFATAASNPPQKKAATPATKAPSPAVHTTKKGSSPPASHPAPMATRNSTGRSNTAGRPATSSSTSRTPAKTGTNRAATNRYYGRQPVRRSYTPQQAAPSSDRFREIQDALAAKGYLTTPSTGVWDKDSITAMQRFQQDQKLEATGKLTARSLSALGLGSKTAAISASATAPAGSASAGPAGDATPIQ